MKTKQLISCAVAFVLATVAHAAKVQDVKIPSPSMDKEIPAIIVLPDSYSVTNVSYPVLYLLHGYSSSPRQTLDLLAPVLRRAADACPMIIVLPDGGYNSWYFDSPVEPARKYETFIASELVGFVDKHYRAVPSRWARALTGGSMGGHGAMFVGLRHKDVFGMVGSLSGAVDFRPFPDNWDLKQVLGPMGTFPKRWDEHVAINQIADLKPGDLVIYLDVGTKDAFLDVNRVLHKKLLEMDVPHVYVERPGQHDDPYWQVSVNYMIAFFGNTFREGAPH